MLNRQEAVIWASGDLIQFFFWLVAWLAPSHYLNQCWNVADWSLGNNSSAILIETHTFLFKKMHLKSSSGKWQPFCLSLNVIIIQTSLGDQYVGKSFVFSDKDPCACSKITMVNRLLIVWGHWQCGTRCWTKIAHEISLLSQYNSPH